MTPFFAGAAFGCSAGASPPVQQPAAAVQPAGAAASQPGSQQLFGAAAAQAGSQQPCGAAAWQPGSQAAAQPFGAPQSAAWQQPLPAPQASVQLLQPLLQQRFLNKPLSRPQRDLQHLSPHGSQQPLPPLLQQPLALPQPGSQAPAQPLPALPQVASQQLLLSQQPRPPRRRARMPQPLWHFEPHGSQQPLPAPLQQPLPAAHDGSQAPAQPLPAAHDGSQPAAQPLPAAQVASQQVLPQPLLQQPRSNRPRRPANRPQRLPQPEPHGSQQPFPAPLQQPLPAEPQAASQQPLPAPPQPGSQAPAQPFPAPQVASWQALPASQQVGSQQAGLQQPPPTMRSSSPPKLWLHRPALRTSAPRNLENFTSNVSLAWNWGGAPRSTHVDGLTGVLLGYLRSDVRLATKSKRSCVEAVDPSAGCVSLRGSEPTVHCYEHQAVESFRDSIHCSSASDVAFGPNRHRLHL